VEGCDREAAQLMVARKQTERKIDWLAEWPK
jgi:hypothetical protein